jgi:hypothetical protein
MSLLGGSMLADATAASNVMRAFITPAIATLCAIAGLASAGFLVHGGFQYMTSSGKPPDQKRLIISKLFKQLTIKEGSLSVEYTDFARAIEEKVQKTRILMEAK